MYKNALFFLGIILFYQTKSFGQTTGGWGTCEFSTVADMNAFDPSSSSNACKKAFIQATNEHYHWDGAIWLIDNLNIYNSSDTLSADRIVTLDGNDLTFKATATTVQVSSTGEVNIDNDALILKPSDAGAPDEGVLLSKKGMHFISDGDNNATSDNFLWGTNATTISDATLDTLMILSDEGQLSLNNYGQSSPAFNTGSEAYILAVEPDGDVVEMNTAKASKIFYPPAITIDASVIIATQTIDLHQRYTVLYGTPAISSTGAPAAIPTYLEAELYYYIADYDTAILDNISIAPDGVMTYDIIAVPADKCAIITVIFVIK